MSFSFRICRNDVTSLLKETFNATPLKIPESRVRPLIVIAEKGGKTEFRGALEHLLEEGIKLGANLKETPMTDVSFERTKSFDFDFGFEILKGFFQGFGIPSGAIGSQLKGAKEISLSFHNVKRLWVDKNELGGNLRGKQLDLEHPSMMPFLGDDPHQMLLISDAIISNSFSINVEKSNEQNFEIELPEVQEILKDTKVKINPKASSKNALTFEGTDYLTFAFSCIQLILNDSGNLGVGTTFVTRNADGEEVVHVEDPQHIELDDDLFEPGMLVWDN